MNIKTKEHESKPDNLRVERPEIHKTFTRKPLPVIGQDNRSKYEKVQSDNIRNSRDNNQSLYESQHIWNINPTRQVTKNNALSEFQNSKDAIKATTSVGLGTAAITAPLATVRLLKQAALMDKVGRPFILQQTNPIYSNGRPVKAMKSGGRFTFKKSRLLKNDEDLNKRDMRKKVVKSNRPTYSVKRIRKGQDGLRFASYNPIENNNYDMPTANPFSEYSFPELTITKPVQPKETPTQPTVQPVIQPEVQPIEETPIATQWSNNYTGKRGKWVADLTSAYRKAGISNNNALKMLIAQDALESGWGKSAQGDYNFGNITPGKSWKGRIVTGKDKNAKGEVITQKFRAYDSLEDYAKDKVQFLKRLYDFSDTDDIQTFASKLQGGNKDKRKYAESADYFNGLLKVYKGMA